MALVRVLLVVAASGCWTSLPPPTTSSTPIASAPRADAPVGVDAAPAVVSDDQTGFDLYVMPSGVTSWKLDGEPIDTRLPARVRGIVPGPHQIEIDAPTGYTSKTLEVDVELGKAPKLEIELDPSSNSPFPPAGH